MKPMKYNMPNTFFFPNGERVSVCMVNLCVVCVLQNGQITCFFHDNLFCRDIVYRDKSNDNEMLTLKKRRVKLHVS